ncbi:MAG: cysteine hydrolase [Muribaculaceae bacterium]|nr:cysteine hydrolase [Muribaculaceae bacterium]
MAEHTDKIGGMLTHAENAILVVDMENDWVMPGSPMRVAGAYDTLPAIKKFLDYGRANNWAVIYIYRIHRISGIAADLFRRHFFEEGHPFCIDGTTGAAIPEEIAPQPGDISVKKQRFSAFFGTDLDIILRGLGAKNIYITGTQYPNCIRSTAVDSMSLDYNTTVVTDCCSAATEEVANANIFDLRNMGIPCVDSKEIMRS